MGCGYQLWQDDESETHWRVLVTSAIQERATVLHHELPPAGRADRVQAERAIAQQIAEQHANREDRLKAWRAQTGKSERAFYRRLQAA